jgi:DNA repair protein RadA/Sms
MAERKSLFRCQQCGHVSPKWLGRCPDCQHWHSLAEEPVRKAAEKIHGELGRDSRPVLLRDVAAGTENRIAIGMEEWDRVLGGGLVPGSMVLLAGDPGIGKSTLLLQALARLARERRVLYVSGEESPQQLKLRAGRLQIAAPHLYVHCDTSLDTLLDILQKEPPEVLAVDSIQTMQAGQLELAPGSISQVRECSARLMRVAKETNVSTFLIGHVTKEGAIAGPRVLEHLVDTVLYLEGDRSHAFRLLRAVKNRYGSTNEIGVFEMKESGLEEVHNPSQLLLAERPLGFSGSVVMCCVEGTRPLLVEIQALVSATSWAQPRRTSIGVDGNRLSILVAVLEKRLGFHFPQQDVFLNVAGGVRLTEPALDLAVIAALMSSYLDKSLPSDLVVWGEVGLAGEVRGVTHTDLRLSEARKLGFSRCLLPKSNADRLPADLRDGCVGVRSLPEVLGALFGELP